LNKMNDERTKRWFEKYRDIKSEKIIFEGRKI
jgi:hypothetical protein